MCWTVFRIVAYLPVVQLTTEKTVVEDSMYGGNASAEGGTDEGAEDVSSSGCNIVLANRLENQSFDKTAFKLYIKVIV